MPRKSAKPEPVEETPAAIEVTDDLSEPGSIESQVAAANGEEDPEPVETGSGPDGTPNPPQDSKPPNAAKTSDKTEIEKNSAAVDPPVTVILRKTRKTVRVGRTVYSFQKGKKYKIPTSVAYLLRTTGAL